MRNLFLKLWKDDAGVVTLEYLVLGTFLGLALIVGVTTLASGINVELTELTNAILSFNQSYSSTGYSNCRANKAGSQAIDINGLTTLTPTPPIPSVIDVTFCTP